MFESSRDIYAIHFVNWLLYIITREFLNVYVNFDLPDRWLANVERQHDYRTTSKYCIHILFYCLRFRTRILVVQNSYSTVVGLDFIHVCFRESR